MEGAERLLVLCPSYRRPDAAAELAASFRRTVRDNTKLSFLVWEGDPDATSYLNSHDTPSVDVVLCPEQDMAERCNGALGLLDAFSAVGWVADDNRFETPGWDEAVLRTLAIVPICFGNDVVSPGSKPSHVFMDSRVPRALGWLILPGVRSTFFDDAWASLGVGPIHVAGPLCRMGMSLSLYGSLGRIIFGLDSPGLGMRHGLGIEYLPEVRIPHLYVEHTGDAHRAAYEQDMEVYRRWLRHRSEEDIERSRRALRSRRDAGGPEGGSRAGAQLGAQSVRV